MFAVLSGAFTVGIREGRRKGTLQPARRMLDLRLGTQDLVVPGSSMTCVKCTFINLSRLYVLIYKVKMVIPELWNVAQCRWGMGKTPGSVPNTTEDGKRRICYVNPVSREGTLCWEGRGGGKL